MHDDITCWFLIRLNGTSRLVVFSHTFIFGSIVEIVYLITSDIIFPLHSEHKGKGMFIPNQKKK